MDPMDFTMDEGPQNQHPSTGPRCQYQQAQQPSSSNTFNPSSREAHHYDPVYNTDSWFHANGNAGQARSQYSPPQNIPQWNPGPYVPISGWRGFGEAHTRDRISEPPDYMPPAGFMGMSNSPWAEIQGYEPLPFGYTSYTNIPNANPISVDSTRSSSNGFTPSSSVSQTPQQSMTAIQAEQPRQLDRADQPVTTNTSSDNANLSERARLARLQTARDEHRQGKVLRSRNVATPSPGPTNQNEHIALQAHWQRSYDSPRTHGLPLPPDIASRMRRNHIWDSDDDEESIADIEIGRYSRGSQQLFSEYDEERAMAAMRGAMAAGKKVPSKEAIASLEKVPISDLKEADRTCMICYNEYGLANPEGITECPIRLPKCKHVYGEKCIKKWFEDSDSCPYCRDKLPSEAVGRRTIAFETLRAQRERVATITSQAYRAARHGFPRYQPSDELTQERTSFIRPTQEEHHYIMRGGLAPESWSFSPPNRASPRESPENRRRQNRGRPNFARPTSVGSARHISQSTNHQNMSQRAHFTDTMTNAHSSGVSPRRSTPGLNRQNTDGPSPGIDNLFSIRHNGTASSAEEASPPVVVGSGVAVAERSASLTTPQQSQNSFPELWTDPQYLAHHAATSFPPTSRSRASTDEFSDRPFSAEARSRSPHPEQHNGSHCPALAGYLSSYSTNRSSTSSHNNPFHPGAIGSHRW